MKEERYFLSLDDFEQGILIRALNDKKTDLIRLGKSTDFIDDLIIKIGNAPTKKFKTIDKDMPNAR